MTQENTTLEYRHMRHAQLNRDLTQILDFAKNILDDHEHLKEHVETLATYINAVREGEN